jgi:hypothetical protein
MRHLRGGEYITPNISLIDDGKRVYSEKKVSSNNILTFPITLVEGDNGQIGKELYKYIIANAEYNDNYMGTKWNGYMKVLVKTECWMATYIDMVVGINVIECGDYEILEKYDKNCSSNHRITLNEDGFLTIV